MLKQVLDVLDMLDDPSASGSRVVDVFRGICPDPAVSIETHTVAGDKGTTDFVSVTIPGTDGRIHGGPAPTLGVIGRLGGAGARPELIGYVSDGDGATSALSLAAKLLEMHSRGDVLPGDVVVRTHVCPDAPTRPHDPVPFMDSPVDMDVMNREEVDESMEAIISIDTTKGNRIINHRGIAISNTVRRGYILPVSTDFVDVYETVCGFATQVFPLSNQDITPYSNELYHINSILQPATASAAPVVGVALTTESAVAGSATGASHEADIALAAGFALEVAKRFGAGNLAFHDAREFDRMVELYGDSAHLQTSGSGTTR